jgi:hypothetical protein
MELLKISKTTSYGHRYGIFKCSKCGQLFETKIYHIASGAIKFCKDCNIKNRSGKKASNFKDLTGQRFGYLTVVKYLKSKTCGFQQKEQRKLTNSVWLCRCDCGNFIERTTNELTTNKVSSCPNCHLKSRGEYLIKTALDTLKINYECQKIFQDCKDIKALPFDFYLPEYNCCIEYDGLTHYKPNVYGSWNTPENVLNTQKHDAIKTAFCKNNNITLIRIPYTSIDKISVKYIKEICQSILN